MSYRHMFVCYSAEPGAMALDTLFHRLLVQGCCILDFYTSSRLHKLWYTVQTCSMAPSYHQLKMKYFYRSYSHVVQ